MGKIRCAALMKATPYRARGKLFLTWWAAPPKRRFLYEASVKNGHFYSFTLVFTFLPWSQRPDPRPGTGCAQKVLPCGCMVLGQPSRSHLGSFF